jgi:O-antigen biosynthesis protein
VWSSWCSPTIATSRLLAGRYKLHPHLAFPDVEYTLWIDASHQLKTSSAVQGALDCAGSTGVAVHTHPARPCIYAEADASIPMRKYQDQPIREQVEAYREEGHPRDWGLWACGVIASIRGPMDEIFDAWWDENVKWSYQDQISLPVVCRRAGVRPGNFPHHQLSSPWFAIGGHNRDD